MLLISKSEAVLDIPDPISSTHIPSGTFSSRTQQQGDRHRCSLLQEHALAAAHAGGDAGRGLLFLLGQGLTWE